jgi:hypothetical protein
VDSGLRLFSPGITPATDIEVALRIITQESRLLISRHCWAQASTKVLHSDPPRQWLIPREPLRGSSSIPLRLLGHCLSSSSSASTNPLSRQILRRALCRPATSLATPSIETPLRRVSAAALPHIPDPRPGNRPAPIESHCRAPHPRLNTCRAICPRCVTAIGEPRVSISRDIRHPTSGIRHQTTVPPK